MSGMALGGGGEQLLKAAGRPVGLRAAIRGGGVAGLKAAAVVAGAACVVNSDQTGGKV